MQPVSSMPAADTIIYLFIYLFNYFEEMIRSWANQDRRGVRRGVPAGCDLVNDKVLLEDEDEYESNKERKEANTSSTGSLPVPIEPRVNLHLGCVGSWPCGGYESRPEQSRPKVGP
jgi:hypothetical protein